MISWTSFGYVGSCLGSELTYSIRRNGQDRSRVARESAERRWIEFRDAGPGEELKSEPAYNVGQWHGAKTVCCQRLMSESGLIASYVYSKDADQASDVIYASGWKHVLPMLIQGGEHTAHTRVPL